MTTFAALQATYTDIEIALMQSTSVITAIRIPKTEASRLIISAFAALLQSHDMALTDLSFLTVSQGPGPFTTLRVVLACVNGISFAANLPLVGVNALEVFVQENHSPEYPHTVALWNAFNNDVYSMTSRDSRFVCKKGSVLLEELKDRYPDEMLRFIGNAAALHSSDITRIFGNKAYYDAQSPQANSITALALHGLELWQRKENISYQLMPLYYKQAV